MRSERIRLARAELPDSVKSIIESRGLSLHAVSQQSETIFGHGSPHFVPHNLYYELTLGTFSPSLHQLFALSRITGYRLFDWLHVFGLDPEEIPRLQILLTTKRTVLLDSTLGDPNAWVRWFRNKSDHLLLGPVAPLSQLLQSGLAVRQNSFRELRRGDFLYARIGQEDAFAFPDLLPGSIVRVNRKLADTPRETVSRRTFLVEHSKGICCGRLLPGDDRHITLVSTHLPYAAVHLRLHREAKILGVVDLEIRRLIHSEMPGVPSELAKRWKPEPLGRDSQTITQFLRAARAKAGLSLRAASQLSRQIANLLNDSSYFVSASSFSDYETGEAVPKHFQKAVSLCLSYSIPFRTFLRVTGIADENAGTDSIPDQFIPRLRPNELESDTHEPEHEGFLGELIGKVGDIPLFLRHSINGISGLPSSSLRTVFWVGGIRNPMHQYLANALLISVDRHKKLPIDSRSRPPWKQSFYVVLKRDGNYVVGPCAIENGALVIYPDLEHLNLREEFRNHRDAEVVGQVCTVVRKL